MAALVLLRNPLAPHTREVMDVDPGTRVIDWLQLHHPRGFGMPIRFYVNGEEQSLDDLDYAVDADDVAILALMPADGGTLTMIAINLAIAAAVSAASYFMNQAFAPKVQQGTQGKPVSVYDIASDQNAARLGDPIPVVYGSVLMAPDYVAQPYVWYDWDQSNFTPAYNGIQYLDMLLCVGQGDIEVTDVFIGDTDSTTVAAGVVAWQVFKPAQHLQQMGTIAAAMGSRFHENVVSSPEVSSQEFNDAADTAGFFATCKPGNKGLKFQIDIVFPNGQFDPDNTGDIRGRTTYFTVDYVELDDNDNQIGSIYSTSIKASTYTNTSITGPDNSVVYTSSVSDKNKTAIASPLRRSYMIVTPKSARWAVRLTRISSSPNAKNGTDRFIWVALKLYADYGAGAAYGAVTLLAIRIRGSQGFGQDASARVRVRANKLIAPPAGGTQAASTSGADAFADAYVNAVYGAARPAAELDITTLTALRTKWASYQFNHVFRERMTVWEALRTITTPFGAEPLPIGAMMSVAQDGVKPVRSMLFTDANIIDGSMTVGYSFDEEGAADGVEIEYLDPKDWRQSYTVWPTTSLRPDRFSLPGVTNVSHAQQYARLTWQRSELQRKRITFDTELEGLILQLGDRIGVSHNVPKWGDGGLVIGQAGNLLTVDHDLDWSGGSKQLLLRKPDGSVTDAIFVTQGAQPNIVVLPAAPPTTINVDNEYDYTSFAFGFATTLVRDFVVVSTKPTGENTVTVEAVNYAPDLFTGAMSFMV